MVAVDASFERERALHTRRARQAIAPLAQEITTDAARRERQGVNPVIDQRRWSPPLTTLLGDIGEQVVRDVGPKVTVALGGTVVDTRATAEAEPKTWSPDGTAHYIAAIALGLSDGELAAAAVILAAAGREGFLAALATLPDRLGDTAESMVDTSTNFAAQDAGERAGAGTKRWQVNSGHPRSSHSGLAGEEVPMDGRFSNGLRYPRSPGPPAETAYCKCSLVIVKEEGEA